MKQRENPARDWPDDHAHFRTEEKFLEYKDAAFAALEIGRWYSSPNFPNDAPKWALDACAAIYLKSVIGLEPAVGSRQGPKPYPSDYELIDKVANALVDQPATKSTRKMFADLLQDSGAGLTQNLDRLMGYWGEERRDARGFVDNAHVQRVAKRKSGEAARKFGIQIRDITAYTPEE